MIKKGLVLALTVVAFASIQIQSAQASAPVINDILEVIIGDVEGSTPPATGTGVFVYADAVNLSEMVSDDDTAATAIKWSFAEASGDYTINGVAGINVGVDDPTDPPAGNRIDQNDLDPGVGPAELSDSDPLTITFRDSTTGTGLEPFGTVLNSSTITLFASDCTTFSTNSFPISTVVGQTDTLSQNSFETIENIDFVNALPTGADAWTGAILNSAVNGGSTDDTGGNGLCMTVALAGPNFPFFVSPERFIDIVDDAVFRVIAQLNVLAPASPPAGTLPVTEFIFDNFQVGVNTTNNYGGQNWMLDSTGGNNGIGRLTNSFTFYAAPVQSQVPRWKDYIATPGTEDSVDMRLAFRLNDTSAGLNAQLDEGTICVEALQVDRIDRSAFTNSGAAAAFSSGSTPIAASDYAYGANNDPAGSADIADFATISGAVRGNVSVSPGPLGTVRRQTFFPFLADTGQGITQRLYPVEWVAGATYRTRLDIRFENAADLASSPPNVPDALLLNMDTTQSEIGAIWNAQRGLATSNSDQLPDERASTLETYLYGQQGTSSGAADANRLRGSLQVIDAFQYFSGSFTSTGVMIIDGYHIDVLNAPGN